MPYAPRTIAFLCELLHPPLAPDPGPLQRIHNRLFQTGAPLYRSFTVTGDGAVLSNPASRSGAASSLSFHADRFRFREELTGLTPEDFAQRVKEMAAMAIQERGIQLFTAQVVTLRTLVNPQRFADGNAFLRDGVFGFRDELEELGRTPGLYGLRLVFPPAQDEPNAFALRVETFANDPRSLFLENQGRFGALAGTGALEHVERNVRATYDFVVERALPFLGRFDARQEA